MSFSCHACCRRLFRAVLNDHNGPVVSSGSLRRPLALHSQLNPSNPYRTPAHLRSFSNQPAVFKRRAQTTASRTEARDVEGEENRTHRRSAWGRSQVAKQHHKLANRMKGAQEPRLLGRDRRTASTRKRTPWVERHGPRSHSSGRGGIDANAEAEEEAVVAEAPKNNAITRSAKKELVWLQDPLMLADRVKKLLDSKSTEQALTLTRLASKDRKCTVSWNHVLDHHLQHLGPRPAWALYNEMKKRAQKPDSYTYLIMLRGLADQAHHSSSLGRALTVYHSMSAPNSECAPTIKHTNALLKVAARSNKSDRMDTIWSIVAKLEDNGPQAADRTTYTTLLNAIRYNAAGMAAQDKEEMQIEREESDEPTLESSQVRQSVADQVVEARKLWAIIVKRWREGHLILDEPMVCAMGRLLLLGRRPRDWEDVFSLVEQTMKIPRLVPGLGSAKGSLPASPEFTSNATSLQMAGRQKNGQYVVPSSNTLSLLQEAALMLRSKQASTAYWEFLTDRNAYGLKPDLDNVHARLRVLRLSRSTGDALELLQTAAAPVDSETPGYQLKLEGKTFRIALSTCTRSAREPPSLTRASQMMELMIKTLPQIDIKSAYVFAFMVFKSENASTDTHTLLQLEAIRDDIMHVVSTGKYPKGQQAPLGQDTKQYALMILQKMVSIYHRFLVAAESGSVTVDAAARKRIDRAKRRLDAFVFEQRNQNWAHGRDEPVADDETMSSPRGRFLVGKLRTMGREASESSSSSTPVSRSNGRGRPFSSATRAASRPRRHSQGVSPRAPKQKGVVEAN